MSRLNDMIPPGEIVRWRSPPVIRPRRLLGWAAAYVAVAVVCLALYDQFLDRESTPVVGASLAGGGALWLVVYLLTISASKAAVTEAHIVWVNWAWSFDRDRRVVRLRDIRAVDLEEGRRGVTLYCDGETPYFELSDSRDLLALGRATGRPARLWRKSTSPAARRARRWEMYSAAIVTAATAGVVVGLSYLVVRLGGIDSSDRLVAILGGAMGASMGNYLAALVGQALPHLLVGWRLTGVERRDFVGALVDPRWRGLNPNGAGADPDSISNSRLVRWAMRMAYGEIPDFGGYGPEIIVPGDFPEAV